MIHCFPRKLLSSIWIKEMARLIREEVLEVMQSDLRKNKKINQIRTQKDTRINLWLLWMYFKETAKIM